MPTAPINIAGEGVILGASYVADRKAFIEEQRRRYAETPVFPAEAIPSGRGAHIGEGVWLYRCPECSTFALTYGVKSYISKLAEHTASHGVAVPGYNAPLL